MADAQGVKRPEFEVLGEGSSVGKAIGVVSGKGGVGKSMVTALSAIAAKRSGLEVGILDADITGPSIPMMFGIHKNAEAGPNGLEPAKTESGIEIMSLNLLTNKETDPVIWRGPILANAVKQFWTDVYWGELDVLMLDMPPGTGDVPLTIFQSIPIDGIIVVASPQDLVAMIVEKALRMAKMMGIPVYGLVENMSYFKCPDCGGIHEIFGKSNIDEVAKKFDLPVLAKLPIDPALSALSDEGRIEDVEGNPMGAILEIIGDESHRI
jgi:Mrp family chromosome partitioning ATPase